MAEDRQSNMRKDSSGQYRAEYQHPCSSCTKGKGYGPADAARRAGDDADWGLNCRQQVSLGTELEDMSRSQSRRVWTSRRGKDDVNLEW